MDAATAIAQQLNEAQAQTILAAATAQQNDTSGTNKRKLSEQSMTEI